MENSERLLTGCVGVLAIAWLLSRIFVRQPPLPPGPPGRWLWGNMAEINVPHRPVKAAVEWRDLYEKRAAETSDRPRNVFVRELMGWNTSTVLHRHNDRHQQLRKTMASVLQQRPLVEAVRAGQIYMEDGLATHRWVFVRRLEFANIPFDTVMDRIRRNEIVRSSFTSRLLEQHGGASVSKEDVDLIKWSAASLFGGMVALTVSILAMLIFCLVLHPEVTKKAQEEIDRVIGCDRLPTVYDRGSLPYVEAVLQEAMRYYPVVPLCIPHSTEKDIEFRGYRIPQGSSIEPNIWAILHDPDTYSNPHIFRPERYLQSPPAPDPRKYIFGFGRRVCPGIHIAYDSTFINCAGLISVFDFEASPELLASVEMVGGRESPDIWKLFNSSKIVRPKPFKCSIRPRNDAARLLLETSVAY
ncbi:cytochrome P450 [Rhizoctonia solani]|nr:cytochrome P450 [Rhizoctonia solani]